MQTSDPVSGFHTFRDPAGSLHLCADGAYRRVLPPYDEEILAFLGTSLAARLVAQSRLIDSEVLAPISESDNLVLRHPRIRFQSYPWEWPPTLWLAAAKLTLDLCRELVEEGWILKDATPLNVLFRGSQPVFVDVLSISRLQREKPIWYAYGQFVRMFLLPMLAYQRLGWPLHATLLRRDGYEPEELFPRLSWHDRWRQPALSAVTLPRIASGIGAPKQPARPLSIARDPEISQQIILSTLSRLLRHMRAATPSWSSSAWSGYAETATHYSCGEHDAKKAFVSRTLEKTRPKHVLDVGCNFGVYSALAAAVGAEVVAIDTDLNTVDRLSADLQKSGINVLPLCVDLTRPTPAAGWDNQESASFLDRCAGTFDMVMLLAVIHHLLIGSQVPLDRIAALCDRITTRHLIVEWVPATDPKFQEILRGRDALYAHLTEAAFRREFASYFRAVSEEKLANGRILFHFEKA